MESVQKTHPVYVTVYLLLGTGLDACRGVVLSVENRVNIVLVLLSFAGKTELLLLLFDLFLNGILHCSRPFQKLGNIVLLCDSDDKRVFL